MYLISESCLKMVILVIFYYFLKIIGLTPASLQFSQYRINSLLNFRFSWLGAVYNIILIITFLALSYFSIEALYSSDYPHKTATTENIEVAKAIFGTIILVILWSSITMKQKTALKIFNTCADIDYSMAKYQYMYRPESATLRLASFFGFNVFIWIMLALSDYLSFDKIPEISFVATLGPNFTFNWFLVTYTCVIILLEVRVRAVNRGILQLCHCSIAPYPGRSEITSDKFIVNNVLVLKFTRERLYETIRDVSTFCSFSIMLIITEMCGSIVYTSYYLIAPILLESLQASWLLVCNSMCYLAMEIFPIAVMSISISRIMRELADTATSVHKLFHRSVLNRELTSELKIFSLELLHENINFTACGIFPLDCTLLHSICSMTVTYLIILIQFQTGSTKDKAILAPNKLTKPLSQNNINNMNRKI